MVQFQMSLPWPIRGRNLFLFQQLPLYGLEEGVGRDLHEAALAVAAESVGRVLVQEALEDAGSLHGQGARDTDGLLKDNLQENVFERL